MVGHMEVADPNEVICPNCVHGFRAIPENVQHELHRLRERELQAGALLQEGKEIVLGLASDKDRLLRLVDLFQGECDCDLSGSMDKCGLCVEACAAMRGCAKLVDMTE